MSSVVSPLDVKLSTGVGGVAARAITKAFGYQSVGDFLAHYPRRYARRGELTSLAELTLDENVTIVAEVRSVNERSMRAKRGSILEVSITDGRGFLTLTFFNQKWRAGELRPGVRGIFAGKVGEYRGVRQLAHPDYELFDNLTAAGAPASLSQPTSLSPPTAPTALDAVGTGVDTGTAAPKPPDGIGTGPAAELDAAIALGWAERPIPIYPATSTLASWKLGKTMEVALGTLPDQLEGPVPDEVRDARGLLPFRDALQQIHRPATDAEWKRAQDALRFQEAFVLQASLLRQRAERRAAAATVRTPGRLVSALEAEIPFELTGDQQNVGAEIERDLASGVPMNRLVQGEVGSGKTLVALRAMLTVADSGGQSAFLAPTEVLAGQHLRSLVATLGPDLAARLRPTLLTGQLTAPERRRAMLAAASGGASIVVGTHALLGDRVTFADLGLVVVDEQHRFGVDQREALRLKGTAPHVLVLTATPIPRTVAMTVFGDLDVSTIAELPAGRAPIESHVVALADHPGWEPRIWERLAEELGQGRQAFVVCPAIDDPSGIPDLAIPTPGRDAADLASPTPGLATPNPDLANTGRADPGRDDSGRADPGHATSHHLDGQDPFADPSASPAAAVLPTLEQLRSHPLLRGHRIEALHGRMSSDEKDTTMRAFAAGAIDVLVATTVIEVGVDVPNASMMVVLDADRFGVAQLHQLRGRIGRGGVPSVCLFVTGSERETPARERVDAVAATLDGFALAQVDLELRREGNVLGASQSGGRSSLKLLRVAKDGDLIAEARAAAEAVLAADADLAAHVALRAALDRRLDESERAFLEKG